MRGILEPFSPCFQLCPAVGRIWARMMSTVLDNTAARPFALLSLRGRCWCCGRCWQKISAVGRKIILSQWPFRFCGTNFIRAISFALYVFVYSCVFCYCEFFLLLIVVGHRRKNQHSSPSASPSLPTGAVDIGWGIIPGDGQQGLLRNGILYRARQPIFFYWRFLFAFNFLFLSHIFLLLYLFYA